MRTHGWRGDPPRDDDEARRRIIEATARCVDRYGARKTGLTDVAEDLGVTRATVYRYYRNFEELMKATSLAAAGEFADRLKAHVAHLSDPAELLVELLAFVIERLPAEPYVGLLITTGHTASLGVEILSPTAIGLTRSLLAELPVDWAACGYREADLADLAEYLLRLLHSFIPGPDDRSPRRDDPRLFLRRWLVPAFDAARSACSASGS
jgi:AcrR family transcriptional regulator